MQFNRANAVAQLLSTTEHGLTETKALYLKALETEREAIGDLSADPLAAKVRVLLLMDLNLGTGSCWIVFYMPSTWAI